MIRVGIVGASGYTGLELMRLIALHPGMEAKVVTAQRYAGVPVHRLYPSLAGYDYGDFLEYEPDLIDRECDAVFLGLPHGESMRLVPELLALGKKVVDLSSDFRFKDADLYREVYGLGHRCPELLERAVYGLPEINRSAISGAELVANPGCYPTSVLLGLAPLARRRVIGERVIVDSKSGVSGAGRGLSLGTHYPQAADGLSPYAVGGHRHLPEMSVQLDALLGLGSTEMLFTPHLAPMNRGILSTMYVQLDRPLDWDEAQACYLEAYGQERFVQLLDRGEYPSTKNVQGSNNCHIGMEVGASGDVLVLMSAIDNLVKGASGQAVQNMNILCGLPEDAGLGAPGLFP